MGCWADAISLESDEIVLHTLGSFEAIELHVTSNGAAAALGATGELAAEFENAAQRAGDLGVVLICRAAV